MRVILTEEQLKTISILKENTDFAEKIKGRVNEIKVSANKLYNVIAFATIAEIRDGDVDILVMENKVEKLDDSISNLGKKISDYFDRYDDEVYNARKLEVPHLDLENRLSTAYNKVNSLEKIIAQIKPLSKVDEYGEGRENDWDAPFGDITPTEI